MRLVWYALAVALAAALAGPLEALRPVAMLMGAGLVLIALVDLAFSYWTAQPLTAEVPSVMRLTKDRVGKVPVTLNHPESRERTVRFGLAWPAGIEAAEVDHVVELAKAAHSGFELTCTPRRRGSFRGLMACIESRSRLGLWLMRAKQPLIGELRVYPNLFSERRQLAALFLARAQQGAMLRRMVGRGRDFEKLRDYLPGDGFDEIHWKATAKRGRPITKVFQVERTQEIYVILDTSRLSARAVTHDGVVQTALERCVTATLVLLLAAERMGDRFGLVVHDDRVRLFLRSGRGKSHYGTCREALLRLQPSEATPDLAEIVRYVRSHLRQRSLLFFLTDLTDPVLAEDFSRYIQLLARQHLVLVSQLRAPGVAPLFEGSEAQNESELYARLAGHTRWAETRELAQKLKPMGVTAALLENETMAAQLVAQYLQVKRRQAL